MRPTNPRIWPTDTADGCAYAGSETAGGAGSSHVRRAHSLRRSARYRIGLRTLTYGVGWYRPTRTDIQSSVVSAYAYCHTAWVVSRTRSDGL
eukprot:1861892-Rhodomonas_salina.4